MKRSVYALLFAFHALLTTGCFGGLSDTLSGEDGNGISFEIEGSVWTLSLAENWEEIDPETLPSQTVLAAQNLTQNFIVEQYPDFREGIGERLWERQEILFSYFEGVSLEGNQWQFKAQSRPDKPLRHYYQKVFAIPGTTNYLLGSCSHETVAVESDCQAILDSWQKVEEK